MEKPHHPEDGRTRGFTVPATALPFVVIGALAVVAGGLVAAVTSPLDWDHGSWVAAYLVLVVGVAQIGLGAGQAAMVAASPRVVVAELIVYNVGSVVVLVGTLVGAPAVVTVGGADLVIALAIFAATGRRGEPTTWVARLYTAVLVVLMVSIPIGIALSWARH